LAAFRIAGKQAPKKTEENSGMEGLNAQGLAEHLHPRIENVLPEAA
jgi:hypothetical protein